MLTDRLSIIAILGVAALFGLFLLSIHLKDMRKRQRRKMRLFAPIEHRRRDRRTGAFSSYLAWAMGARRT
jgi:hypothetical protein